MDDYQPADASFCSVLTRHLIMQKMIIRSNPSLPADRNVFATVHREFVEPTLRKNPLDLAYSSSVSISSLIHSFSPCLDCPLFSKPPRRTSSSFSLPSPTWVPRTAMFTWSLTSGSVVLMVNRPCYAKIKSRDTLDFSGTVSGACCFCIQKEGDLTCSKWRGAYDLWIRINCMDTDRRCDVSDRTATETIVHHISGPTFFMFLFSRELPNLWPSVSPLTCYPYLFS